MSDPSAPNSERETGDMEQSPPDPETLERSMDDQLREEYAEKRLDAEERAEALRKHAHHLVRDTTSEYTLRPDVGPGMEAEATVEIPDTYCFTCEEWVGLSGVDLRGTPRSQSDAYYLGGAPEAVHDLKHRVRHEVTSLAGSIIDQHPEIDTPEKAAQFIAAEIEEIQGRLVTDE